MSRKSQKTTGPEGSGDRVAALDWIEEPLSTSALSLRFESQEWLTGWNAAPGRTGARTRHTATFSSPSRQNNDGHEPETLGRTLFAVMLAVLSGVETMAMVAEDGIYTLRIEPSTPVRQLARQWKLAGQSPLLSRGHAPHDLTNVRYLVTVGQLPAFTFSTATDLDGGGVQVGDSLDLTGPNLAALFCHIREVDNGTVVTLSARSGVADDVLLAEFADQLRGLYARVAAGGDPTPTDVLASARQLTFDVNFVAYPGMRDAMAALAAWGRAVRLPLRVQRLEPEQTMAICADASGDIPQPWATNVFVISRRLDLSDLVGANENETRELYDEIVIRNRYLRHGLQIIDGDCVVDVGANIGMFTRFAAACADNVTVAAFEPVPYLADLFEANTQHLGGRVALVRAGLGARSEQRVITYYPRSSLQSGFYADSARDETIVHEYARQQYVRQRGRDLGPSEHGQFNDVLASEIRARAADSRRLEVPVVRLSDWLDERSIDRVHLLKVDAERAEEDVLAGVDNPHWDRIDQVVAEVHDIEGRLDRIRSTLQGHGFVTHAEQDELFAGSEIFMLYARRPGPRRPPNRWMREQLADAVRWATDSGRQVFVTIEPGSSVDDALQARDLVRKHGLTWIDAGNSTADRDADPDVPDSPRHAALHWAGQVLRAVTAVCRPVTKAVLVDADNTLWEGVCGEVGPEHVDPGGPYRDVQKLLVRQRQAGRALVLCTRNNPEDIEAVFAQHPDMPLSLHDFAAIHAIWGPKSASVAATIAELDFAPESLVFIDDNPAERAEVGSAYPGMTVVNLPADPADFPAVLRAVWQLALDAPLTVEDRSRADLLASEARRRAVAGRARTIGDFLDDLDLDVEIADTAPEDADRVAQLSARTTQFNVSLRGHTSAGVRRLCESNAMTLSVRVRDRFGDDGLVGFVSAEPDGASLRISDLFLSCRALGRNVEWRILQELGARALDRGLLSVTAKATVGPRNRPARDFLAAATRQLSTDAHMIDATAAAGLDWRTIEAHRYQHQDSAVSAPMQAPATVRAWPVGTAAAFTALQEYEQPRAASTSTAYAPPAAGLEELIATVWEQVLGVQPVGAHDDLFAIGGDSLTAAMICMRLHDHDVSATLHDLLTHPTVRGLASHHRRSADPTRATAPQPTPGGRVPASFGQQRVWAAEQVGRRGNAQIIPAIFRISGDLDVHRLRSALRAVTRRHAALRTNLTVDGDSLLQRTAAGATVELPVREVEPDGSDRHVGHRSGSHRDHLLDAAVVRAAAAFFALPTDLQRDLMLRAELLAAGDGEHHLLLAVHHSAADGWSTELIRRDLSAAYHHPDGVEGSTVAFTEYAANVAGRNDRGEFAARAERMAARLSRGTAVAWSAVSGRHADPRHLWFPLPAQLNAAVHATARRYSTVPLTMYLAAFQVVLASLTGPGTLITGCPMANRSDPRFTDTVGFFANIVPVAFPGNWNSTVSDLITGAAEATAEATAAAEVPYGLVAERYWARTGPDRPAIFDTLFTLQPPVRHPLTFDECVVETIDPPIWPLPYPLMLDVHDDEVRPMALLRYDAAAQHPVPPPWLADAYPLMLDVLCTLPDLPLDRLRSQVAGTSELDQLLRARLATAVTRSGDQL